MYCISSFFSLCNVICNLKISLFPLCVLCRWPMWSYTTKPSNSIWSSSLCYWMICSLCSPLDWTTHVLSTSSARCTSVFLQFIKIYEKIQVFPWFKSIWLLEMSVNRWNSCLWSNPTYGQYRTTTTSQSTKHLTTSSFQKKTIRWATLTLLWELPYFLLKKNITFLWFNSMSLVSGTENIDRCLWQFWQHLTGPALGETWADWVQKNCCVPLQGQQPLETECGALQERQAL